MTLKKVCGNVALVKVWPLSERMILVMLQFRSLEMTSLLVGPATSDLKQVCPGCMLEGLTKTSRMVGQYFTQRLLTMDWTNV